MDPNRNLPIKYGFIGGLIMCIISIVTYLFYRQLFGSILTQSIVSFLFLVVMIFIPVWGVISYKRAMGKLTFPQALTAGMVILFITLTCSSIVSYGIPNWLDKEYPQQVYELVRNNTDNMMERFNATDEDREEALKRIKPEQFRPTASDTVRSLGIYLGFGFILSLIVALFVSRESGPRPGTEVKQEA